MSNYHVTINPMKKLSEIVEYCDTRVRKAEIRDFPGAYNGLQFSNDGTVSKIGAAVDAGLLPFQKAKELGIDFLIVHHGMFWDGVSPVTGNTFDKYKILFDGNIALYSSHLPLDAHSEIGNNAIIAKKLQMDVYDGFAEYEKTQCGVLATFSGKRTELNQRIKSIFPCYRAMEFGSEKPKKIAILSGSGASAIPELITRGIDTLITGEAKQSTYNLAQEKKLNVYLCGHYASEVFGVQALAYELSQKFNLPYEFITTDCFL